MANTRREFLRWGVSSALVTTVLAGGTRQAVAAGSDTRFEHLHRVADGQLVRPADPDYPAAQRSQMREFDNQRPQAVLYAANSEDVRRAVLFAQDADIPLSVRSGGHHLRGWSTGTGLVIDTSRLQPRAQVTGANTVEIGPANTSLDVLERTSPHELAVPAGLCATVCPGGFVTGGGVGLLTAHSGLGSDHLRAAEVVLADGRIVTASPDHEPDLFWALQGGGSNFGVITRFTMHAEPLSRVTNYVLAWPFDSADQVGSAWQHWQDECPEDLGSTMMLMRADEIPGAIPMVVVMGMWTGTDKALQPHLNELIDRAETPPLVNLSTPQSYYEAMIQWWGLGITLPARPIAEDLSRPHALMSDVVKSVVDRPAFRSMQGRFFDRPMPAEGVDRWIDAFATAERPGQTRISTGLRVGGRASQAERTSTAYVHRDASFYLDFSTQQNLSTNIAADKAASDEWSKRGVDTLHPYSTGEAYVNFPDPNLTDWQRAYWAENQQRLQTIKRNYDPHNVFEQPQGITPG